jgi:hypothetical protein
VLAVVLSAGPALPRAAGAAGAHSDPVPITDKCPVSEGGYRYFSDFFEYRIRVWLTGCPWYHGEPVVVQGSLSRNDLVTGAEHHAMTVHCEPGAPPPGDDRPHGHKSTLPQPPESRTAIASTGSPVPAQNGEPHHDDVRRPPDDCVLSIVVEHPPVEHARYEGDLTYPSGLGEQHETLTLDCTTVDDFGGCDPPGSPPNVAPEQP